MYLGLNKTKALVYLKLNTQKTVQTEGLFRGKDDTNSLR